MTKNNWEKEFDLQPFDLIDSPEKIEKVKSFLRQKIKEERERHKQELLESLPKEDITQYPQLEYCHTDEAFRLGQKYGKNDVLSEIQELIKKSN